MNKRPFTTKFLLINFSHGHEEDVVPTTMLMSPFNCSTLPLVISHTPATSTTSCPQLFFHLFPLTDLPHHAGLPPHHILPLPLFELQLAMVPEEWTPIGPPNCLAECGSPQLDLDPQKAAKPSQPAQLASESADYLSYIPAWKLRMSQNDLGSGRLSSFC